MGNQAIGQLSSLASIAGVMHPRQFAEQVGGMVTPDVVEHWMRRGYVPSVKVGKYRLVNVAALQRELTQQAFRLPNGEAD